MRFLRSRTSVSLLVVTVMACAMPISTVAADGGAVRKAKEAAAREAVGAAKLAVAQNRQQTEDWGLWKDTLDHLAKAEEALEQKIGNFDLALKEAEQAKFEADTGLAQIKQQADTWRTAAQFFEDTEKAWVSGRSK